MSNLKLPKYVYHEKICLVVQQILMLQTKFTVLISMILSM